MTGLIPKVKNLHGPKLTKKNSGQLAIWPKYNWYSNNSMLLCLLYTDTTSAESAVKLFLPSHIHTLMITPCMHMHKAGKAISCVRLLKTHKKFAAGEDSCG